MKVAEQEHKIKLFQDDMTPIVLIASTLVVTELRLGSSVYVGSKKSETEEGWFWELHQ